MITANEAKQLALIELENGKNNMLQFLYDNIKEEAKLGSFEYHHSGHIFEAVLNLLKTNGYKIDRCSKRDYIISWDV